MKTIISTILIFCFMNMQVNGQQETIKQKTINVSGVAEMEVIPDEIYVNVQLREYDRKGGGKVDLESIKSEFLKSALSIGLKESDISVQNYQTYDQNYWWTRKNKKKNPDMKAGITYEIRMSTTRKMDELVQKLDDEATENFYISRVDHSKLQEFKKQLKIQAVQVARDKANYLAEAINEKAGEAITINEPNEVSIYPQPMYANMRVMGMQAMDAGGSGQPESAPNIDFKKLKLKFEVTAVFALK